jgi:hypothetical protein
LLARKPIRMPGKRRISARMIEHKLGKLDEEELQK